MNDDEYISKAIDLNYKINCKTIQLLLYFIIKLCTYL